VLFVLLNSSQLYVSFSSVVPSVILLKALFRKILHNCILLLVSIRILVVYTFLLNKNDIRNNSSNLLVFNCIAKITQYTYNSFDILVESSISYCIYNGMLNCLVSVSYCIM